MVEELQAQVQGHLTRNRSLFTANGGWEDGDGTGDDALAGEDAAGGGTEAGAAGAAASAAPPGKKAPVPRVRAAGR